MNRSFVAVESDMLGARQDTGSMLLAGDPQQAADLERRCEALRTAGQHDAQLLDAEEAMRAEPALRLPADGAALLTPRDAQLVRIKGLGLYTVRIGG